MERGGDDLEDDLVVDPDSLPYSDTDDPDPPHPLDEEDLFLPPNHDSEWAGVQNLNGTVSEVSKKRRRQKEKDKRAKKRKVEYKNTNEGPALLTPDLISDFLSQSQQRTFQDWSQMELDDMRIPASSIVDTTSFSAPRTSSSLPDFIRHTMPNLASRISQKPKRNGAPTLLIVTSAALRVTELTRTIRPMKGDKGGDVAKLFARHFKLSEHVSYLQSTKIGVGVGTPDRIGKLLGLPDALQTSALTHILIDSTYLDSKQRTLFDIPETRLELFRSVLGPKEGHVIELVKSGKVQVVLF